MNTLLVSIERNGTMIPVGTIRGDDPSDACFAYLPEYLNDKDAAALSISLPLRAEPYSALQTSRFFEGLLPEGFTRRSVAQWMHVDENDYLSILHGLGRECLGAVCVTEIWRSASVAHTLLMRSGENISAERQRRSDLASGWPCAGLTSCAGGSGKLLERRRRNS